MKEQMISVAAALSPVLVALVGLAAVRLEQYIRAKVKSEYLAGALCRLTDAAEAAVKELQQTMVDGLKSASADGKLTPAEISRVKAEAMSRLKSYVGAKGIAEAGKVLGLTGGALDALLAAKVEAAVVDLHAAAGPT